MTVINLKSKRKGKGSSCVIIRGYEEVFSLFGVRNYHIIIGLPGFPTGIKPTNRGQPAFCQYCK